MPIYIYWGVVACACLAPCAALCAWLAYLRAKASPQRAFPTPAGPYPRLSTEFAELDLDLIPLFGYHAKLSVQLLAPYSVGATGDKETPDDYCRPSAVAALAFLIPSKCWAWLCYGIIRILVGGHKHPDSEVRGSREEGATLYYHGMEQEPDSEVGICELPEASGKKKLPLVVFSHGSFGNMHMHTQLCREFASYGCVVVALECQDGSAIGTLDVPVVLPPRGLKYEDREGVRNFRLRFFQHREHELIALMRYIQETPSAQLPSILRAADPTYAILVGHSLGAAASLRAVKSSIWLRDVTKMLVLYDPWAWPLSDDDVVPSSVRASCFLSEDYYLGKELPAIAHALGHRGELWWLPDTTHVFFGDMAWLFPAHINPSAKKKDPRPAHSALVAKTYAALDKFLGRATPQPDHPLSAIIELQLPLRMST